MDVRSHCKLQGLKNHIRTARTVNSTVEQIYSTKEVLNATRQGTMADPVMELYCTSLTSANRVYGHNEQADANGETFVTYFLGRLYVQAVIG